MRRLSREARLALRDVQPIIAANRGPVDWVAPDPAHPEIGRFVTSEGGGLITAMGTLARGVGATWVATAPAAIEAQLVAASRRGPITDSKGASFTMEYVTPSAREYADYYSTIANPLLWFIQHNLWDIAVEPLITDETMAAWRGGYRAVNRRFADAIVAQSRLSAKPPLVMLQDYHLYLAPAMIREAVPGAVIQHFVHIPWPPPEYWEILPATMRDEIITGMLGNDIIGFQTDRDVTNFARCCEEFLGLYVGPREIHVDGRVVKLRDYPISVDVDAFAAYAADPKTLSHEREISSWRPEHLVVRVDRMDLSKNIVRGFIAFERMLETHPELCGKAQFYAFLQATRGDIQQYDTYMRRISAEVERINGREALRGPNGEIPIRLEIGQDIYRAVAAYKQFDVLLVNPVHDGMNLVAKDGPLVNQRNGVLVLSTGAGAHAELGDFAISVHPYHVDEMARALYEGITMPVVERTRRREAIASHVRAHDLTGWIEVQIADIASVLADRGIGGRGLG